MTFGPRNEYYLRISARIVLPLFLYLDERHADWMSDVVLQHVLADLRPLIVPKLQAEKDVHFGPGVAPGNKQGTVEVHRGETYQFAYFFRKTEPHTVLLKSRFFVTRPPLELAPKPASAGPADRNPKKKGLGTQVSAKQIKRKRSQPKGKKKIFRGRFDENEWLPEESEEDMDSADPFSGEPPPVRKQRRIIIDASQDDDDDDVEDIAQEVSMDSSPSEMYVRSSEYRSGPIAKDRDVLMGASDEISETADIELAVEEEEEKPKPLLKLKYQSFTISGHCLCVVVEPWPPLRAEPKGSVTSSQRGALEPSFLPSNKSVTAEKRAQTPLFLPEYDRAPSEMPLSRDTGTLPPVPVFHDATSGAGDDYSGNDLMNFSQILNATGYMHAIAADDDDDMDGAILFGDADEVRELL